MMPWPVVCGRRHWPCVAEFESHGCGARLREPCRRGVALSRLRAMALPVEKWEAHARRKWASLEPCLQEKLSLAVPLGDTFLLCLPLFQPADEEFLHRLAVTNWVGKDPRAALFYKEEGNKRFQKKEYTAARILYSKAVSHNSPEMSLCYANRSAALFHLGQFEDCLEDIDRAQAQGYPDRLQPKILLRKTECLLLLGRLQEAAGVISKVESKIAMDQSLSSTTRQILLRKVSQLKVKAHEKESSPLSVPEALGKTQKDLEFWEENGKISSASSSVNLNFNSCKGRHLVATKDILPGENLVKEEAFVSVLSPGKSLLLQDSPETTWDTRITNGDLHCHRCFKQLLASVPCGGCSYAKYCSKKCAQLAWEHYHSTECPLGALLLTLGVFSHVALRTVLVAGFAEVSSLVKQFHGDDKELYKTEARGKSLDETLDSTAGMEGLSEKAKSLIPGCEDDGQYQGSYQAVFNLLTHAEKHSPEHKFLCSLSIVAICKKLLDTDLTILSQESCESQSKLRAHVKMSAELSPELKILGEAMLRHMLQLQCNAQAVTAIRESESGDSIVADSEQVCLATALFPVTSLLNHSCDPNTSVTFSGTAVTVRASQPIPRGQEIFHCYGPHRCRMRAAERRQRLLCQYFFECRCQACLDELGSDVTGIVATRDIFCCSSCHASMQGEDVLRCSSGACTLLVGRDYLLHQLWDLQLQVKTALGLLQDNQPNQAVELLMRCQMDAENFLSAEHMLVGEIEDHLAQGYATLGKWQEAARHLQRSIQIVEARHGPSSVETGLQCLKLCAQFKEQRRFCLCTVALRMPRSRNCRR
ncbi:SET and MYND domain-containing protein 4 isoform X2 [Dermochelys coriacea]|uniref:SET and MYND domain-containing protein 4 isoform X2 n=1 Tax=Dermochelys coriacea TaxID=27794 RepID=UPI001CAA3CED|nr:SET and MYND domain-containing protein 4 isoform X2 [Dermochelys coriacea]